MTLNWTQTVKPTAHKSCINPSDKSFHFFLFIRLRFNYRITEMRVWYDLSLSNLKQLFRHYLLWLQEELLVRKEKQKRNFIKKNSQYLYYVTSEAGCRNFPFSSRTGYFSLKISNRNQIGYSFLWFSVQQGKQIQLVLVWNNTNSCNDPSVIRVIFSQPRQSLRYIIAFFGAFIS